MGYLEVQVKDKFLLNNIEDAQVRYLKMKCKVFLFCFVFAGKDLNGLAVLPLLVSDCQKINVIHQRREQSFEELL